MRDERGRFIKGDKTNLGRKKPGWSNQTSYKKGDTSWSKLHPDGMPRGESHARWKGDKVTYGALHTWIYRELGKAKYCLFAKTLYSDCSKTFSWANISGEYKRDLKDWMQLCMSHHKKYDLRKNS